MEWTAHEKVKSHRITYQKFNKQFRGPTYLPRGQEKAKTSGPKKSKRSKGRQREGIQNQTESPTFEGRILYYLYDHQGSQEQKRQVFFQNTSKGTLLVAYGITLYGKNG